MKLEKMKKYTNEALVIIILSLFFVPQISYGQTTFLQLVDQVKENAQHIKSIDEKIVDLKENYRLLYDGAKNQSDQLGNQISYGNYIMAGFGVFLAILGIFIAWFVGEQYRKVKDMKNIVENTKQYIQGHNRELYNTIKRDETLDVLSRLREVPEDVLNIGSLLFSRSLLEEDYLSLKELYLKIKNDAYFSEEKHNYIALLMQHFPYQSLKDPDLRNEMISNMNLSHINIMFIRDIKDFFDGVFKYLREFGMDKDENKKLVQDLFYYFSKSKFTENIELQNYIKEKVLKYQLDVGSISDIVKKRAPDDAVYLKWLSFISL